GLLQLHEISRAIGRESVAAVHESVQEHALNLILLRQLDERVKVALVRMHAAVGHESEEMKLPATGARVLHRFEQRRVLEELAALNHQRDARSTQMHDAPGANVQMADLAVAHLPFGETDERAAGLNERVGIFTQQAVVSRLSRERDGVGIGFGSVTPAVEDDE